jgi:GT2 family glycosyltransferase
VSTVTVAIATFNGRGLLDVVLRSLARQTFSDMLVVVVDDASTDDTVSWLRKHWPTVELVVHPSNMGVAATFNSCVAAAEGSEFLVLLNNDVELEPRCIEELVTALRIDPRAASAGAKLLDYAQRELLDGAGDAYSWAAVAHRRGQGESDRGQYDDHQLVFGACAAAAIYRTAAFEELGGFDEQFFALCEDVDWSFRAQLAGYDCRFVPTAVVYHIGSASLGPRFSDFTLYHNWRNEIWTVAKNYPASAFVLHAHDLVIGQLAAVAVALRHRCVGALVRAWRDALRGLPQALAKRRGVQRLRRRSTRELGEVIQGGVQKLYEWSVLGRGRARRGDAPPKPSSLARDTRDAGRTTP